MQSSVARHVKYMPSGSRYCAANFATSGGECFASQPCCFQKRKCEASEEFTTSTFLMLDWYSWLMRWNTRSEPERSTSTSIFGYSAMKAFLMPSATFTSTDEYQTTLPSFSATACIAGVVSCAAASAGAAASTAAISMRMRGFMFLLLLVGLSGERAAAVRAEAHVHR